MPGATTNFGWPKPVSGDPIAQGADTIGQALDKADAQFYVPVDSFTADTLWSSWPLGVSMMRVASAASATAGNWPIAQLGSVLTIRNSNQAHQFYMSASPVSLFYRYYAASPGSWVQVSGPSVPTAMATGGVSAAAITPNAVSLIPVTYPAGRFASAPRTFLGLATTNPNGFSPLSFSANTATGFTLYVFHPTASAVSFHWQAVLGAT